MTGKTYIVEVLGDDNEEVATYEIEDAATPEAAKAEAIQRFVSYADYRAEIIEVVES